MTERKMTWAILYRLRFERGLMPDYSEDVQYEDADLIEVIKNLGRVNMELNLIDAIIKQRGHKD